MWLFISGMTTMGLVVASLFFLRFWRRTGDTLFVYFGMSFCLLAVSQALAAISGVPGDDRSWIYLLRLAGFLLLIVGIVSKNLRRSTQ